MKADFIKRHVGPSASDQEQMLSTIGCENMEALISKTIPSGIRHQNDLDIADGFSEEEYLAHIQSLGNENKVFDTYIGLGYYNTYTPSVILRNIFENPGWYTAYTPYQAEISQGRLEALLNFQTMVSDLTGLELANASLLDEATAAAESMIMFFNGRSRAKVKANANSFFASDKVFPQVKSVLINRAEALGIDLQFGNPNEFTPSENYFGALIQYPNAEGAIDNIASFIPKCKEQDIPVAVGSDLLALALLKSPGSLGADVVYGSSQRFGIPLGYGGPHAAFFASTANFKRNIPGRIIGVSVDANGNPGLRMALQTREQHIKRDKATSNICTAQALLAIMAGMYAVYHGKEGIKAIAEHANNQASKIANSLKANGYKIKHDQFFDTVHIELEAEKINALRTKGEAKSINFFYGDNFVQLSTDETTTDTKLNAILELFGASLENASNTIANENKRDTAFLDHPIFNQYHSETEMMRYIKRLENKDLSLVHSMISLGSCTMKLNAASELIPLSWPTFGQIHPFVPVEQTTGYQKIFTELEKDLKEITRFDAVSFQPNSGAQGEYAGLMVIRAYHESRGDFQRNIAIIPSSAHGTNPASAVMAGMKVVVVKCDDKGNIDIEDLKAKAEQYQNELSCLMITYPSTHGVFEEGIRTITSIIHQNGGQVYMDGANMNAQVGFTSPGEIGADVCHLNLHKTFAIPHGGGGPGMGPIGVAKHLSPFLPKHPLVKTGGAQGIEPVSAAPWSSSLILLISYGYIKMLGGKGLKQSTATAILNANYIKKKLENHFPILYTGTNDTVAHEMIVDCRHFKLDSKVEVEDIAKRLMDYGFHAPTMSFPVPGTMMIEPTESESKEELDRFISAMISIKSEIDEIAKGIYPTDDNVLKHAPHTCEVVVSDQWNHKYAREKAAYPLNYIRLAKFWPSVGRVDNAYGDRNLICSCPSIESYEEPSLV